VKATSQKIARITNANHRQDAMSLFQRVLTQVCVTRPPTPRPSDDEAGWIAAGIQSANRVPIQGIVVSSQASPPAQIGSSLKEFVADEFWESLANPRLVGRDAVTQEQVLRAICTHSDWLLLRLPQIRGGSDDEIVTVKQIIKLSNQLPTGFRRTVIELQVCEQPNIPANNLINGIKSELSGFIRQGFQIRLTICPARHFINRELLAGESAQTSQGQLVPRPLWWITMTHVAVGSREAAVAGEAGNTWSLFSRQKAHERFEQMKTEPCRPPILFS
jgi:hypothetical protein